MLSLLFKATKCLLNRPLFDKIHNSIKIFIAGMIASLAIKFATLQEVTMIKLMLYPRVIECIFQYLCEKGIIKKFKHGDILAYSLQVIMITYSFLFEYDNMTKGFNRTIGTYSAYHTGDIPTYAMQAARVRAGIHKTNVPMTKF